MESNTAIRFVIESNIESFKVQK